MSSIHKNVQLNNYMHQIKNILSGYIYIILMESKKSKKSKKICEYYKVDYSKEKLILNRYNII